MKKWCTLVEARRQSLLMLAAVLGLSIWAISSDGIVNLALGSVPPTNRITQSVGQITNDTAIYQRLSDIQISPEAKPDFDADIAKLSASESRYKENLPPLAKHPRLSGPMQRISKQQYRYAGNSRK